MPSNRINYKEKYQKLYKKYWAYKKKYENIDKAKISYKNIFKLLRQNKYVSTANFIKKYYKNKKIWSNKLAYFAGIIDGEGYLKVEKWGTIRLIIGMTSKKTIYWIYNNFGGNVTIQKTAKGNNFYVWRLNQGKDLFYLLLLVIPFLITKKQKLVKALKDLISKFEKLEHTFKQMKIMERK